MRGPTLEGRGGGWGVAWGNFPSGGVPGVPEALVLPRSVSLSLSQLAHLQSCQMTLPGRLEQGRGGEGEKPGGGPGLTQRSVSCFCRESCSRPQRTGRLRPCEEGASLPNLILPLQPTPCQPGFWPEPSLWGSPFQAGTNGGREGLSPGQGCFPAWGR